MNPIQSLRTFALAALVSAAASLSMAAMAPATASAQEPLLCPSDLAAVIGPVAPLECAAPEGTDVQLDGTGSSVGTNVTYLWTTDRGVVFDDDASLTPMGTFPVGPTEVTLTVTCTDDLGEVSVMAMTDVVIEDTTPPTLDVVADRSCLWPPNHKLHKISVVADVQDTCDPEPMVFLSSAESNEPDNGVGDGNTVDDIQLGTDDSMFHLRAERQGPGSGRVYSITYTAADAAGNVTDDVVMITVPHDMGNGAGDCKRMKLPKPGSSNNGKSGMTKAEKDAAKAARAAAKAARKPGK